MKTHLHDNSFFDPNKKKDNNNNKTSKTNFNLFEDDEKDEFVAKDLNKNKDKPFIYYSTSLEKSMNNCNDYFSKTFRDHFYHTIQSLIFCKRMKKIPNSTLQNKIVNLPKSKCYYFLFFEIIIFLIWNFLHILL